MRFKPQLKRISRIVISYLILSSLFLGPNAAFAKVPLEKLNLVSGTDLGINLSVDKASLEPDLSKEDPSLRLFFKPLSLIDKGGNFRAIKLTAYEMIGENKSIISVNNVTIGNPKKIHSASIPLTHFNTNPRELFIELANVEAKQVAVYKLTVNAKNLDSQISSAEESLVNSNCDNSLFGECQMKYIIENLSFEAIPKKRPTTKVMKQEAGPYKVQIGVPVKNITVEKNKIKYIDNSISNNENGANASIPSNIVLEGDSLDAPLVLKASTLLANPKSGAIEFDGANLYYSSNGSRKTIAHTGQIMGSNTIPETISNMNLINPNLSGVIDLSPVTNSPEHKDGSTFMTEDGALCMSMNDSYEKLGGNPGASCGEKNLVVYEGQNIDGLTDNDRFGWSSAIKDNELFIGAFNSDSFKLDGGEVSVFTKNGITNFWEYQNSIHPADLQNGDIFSAYFTLDGNKLFSSSHLHEGGTLNGGALYIFEKNGETGNWDEKQKIIPPDIEVEDHFSDRFLIDPYSKTLFVASTAADDGMKQDVGALYVYNYDSLIDSWSYFQKIQPGDLIEGDGFGVGLVYDNGELFVSAAYPFNGSNPNPSRDEGKVYVLEKNPGSGLWEEKYQLRASDKEDGDWFGRSMAIGNSLLVIGAPHHNYDNRFNSPMGAIYIFEKNALGIWEEKKQFYAEHLANEHGYSKLGYGLVINDSKVFAVNSDRLEVFYKDATLNWQRQKVFPAKNFRDDLSLSSINTFDNSVLVGAHSRSFDEAGRFIEFKITEKFQEALVSSEDQNFGIGTNEPQAKLHLNGDLIIQDGTEGYGRVLVSDAMGRAQWSDSIKTSIEKPDSGYIKLNVDTEGNTNVEIRADDAISFLDFADDVDEDDFDSRIIRYPGVNGNLHIINKGKGSIFFNTDDNVPLRVMNGDTVEIDKLLFPNRSSDVSTSGLGNIDFRVRNDGFNGNERSRIMSVGTRAFVDYLTETGGTGTWIFGSQYSSVKDILTVKGSSERVGINTTMPQATLEVNGVALVDIMSLKPSDTPPICDASSRAQIYFDDSSNKPCFCNGTNWVLFEDSFTLCP